MQVSTEHLSLDDRGNARISGTGIKVKHLAMLTRLGYTAEQILHELPHLTRSQIHAALAYYYDHRQAIDDELQKAEDASEAMRNSPEQAAFAARLRERGANRQ